jgi:hypothetical protein
MRSSVLTAVPVLLLLLASAPAFAQAQGGGARQPQIAVTVDREPLVQGEPFQLTITISTESSGEPEIKLPTLGGFRVLQQYESHPMSFSFSFGMGRQAVRQSKRQSEYTYVVVADRPGKYTVNPIIVTVDGQRYQSQSYVFNVTASSGGVPPAAGGQPIPLPPQASGGATAEPAAPPAAPDTADLDLDGAQIDPDYFLHTVVSKKRCGVGEMIVLRVYLYTSWSVAAAPLVREPGTDGFWVENLDTGGKQVANQEEVQIGGRTYERAELRRIALFPVRSGKLTISPALVEIEVRRGGFFSRSKTVRRASAPVVVTVDPLPDSGAPAGFDPANVGSFSFRADLDRAAVRVGEPVTLTMTARGAGNVRNAVLPKIGEIDGVKVYDPESEVDVVAREDSVAGTLTSKVMMIPKRPGSFEVPRIEWSYFDLESKTYKTLTSEAKTVTVAPGETPVQPLAQDAAASPSAAAPQDATAFSRMAQKLRTISSRTDASTSGGGLVLDEPWFLAIAALAPLAYLGILAAQLLGRRSRGNLVRDRAKRADTEARRRLDKLAARGAELDGDEFFAGLHRALRVFLEDRLDAPVAGDTSAELAARLKRRGFDDELADAAVAEMESCDFARFARSAAHGGEREQALNRMRALVARLAEVSVTKEEGNP